MRVVTDDPTYNDEPLLVPVQLVCSAPRLTLQAPFITIDAAPSDTDAPGTSRAMVRSGRAAEVSVTGGVLLFNEGDDVLQLSKFLCNSQHARVGVAKAAEPDCPLRRPLAFVAVGSAWGRLVVLAGRRSDSQAARATGRRRTARHGREHARVPCLDVLVS